MASVSRLKSSGFMVRQERIQDTEPPGACLLDLGWVGLPFLF